MNRSFSLRRSLALIAALALTTLGGVALPAQAIDPGNAPGKGNGNGNAEPDAKHEAKNKDTKNKGAGHQDDKSDKGDKGTGNGPKDKGDKNTGNGPKDKGDKNTGNGPKDKGDKGRKGSGGTGDPAGNNGTVKVTPYGEMDAIPNNSPHPGCVFDIEWYGFDEGSDIVSTVVFAMHAPTADVALSGTAPSEVFVGGDPASGAGTETGFDGEQTYHLAFDGEPHAQQGYHVKLTIHTPGSQGADTKHKVFWVEPCEEAVGGSDTDEDTTTSGTTDETEATGDSGEDTEVAGAQASAGTLSDDTEVMGAQASAPAAGVAGAAGADDQDVPTAVDAGEEGNSFVEFMTSPLPLLVIGLGVAAGAAAILARRRSVGTH